MPEKRGPGRPRIIETPEEMDELVSEYLRQCHATDEPITFTGMALHLGYSCRQSFYQAAELPGFYDSVKRARTIIEREYEKRLSGNSVAGAIFALKNHGWSDRQELEHSGPGGEPISVTRRIVDPKHDDAGA